MSVRAQISHGILNFLNVLSDKHVTRVVQSFQPACFSKWGWLHYDALSDVAYCHKCVRALKSGKMKVTTGRTKESSFAIGGFSNWKDATVACSKHESSATHKHTVNVALTLPATNGDVGKMLCSQYVEEQAKNCHCLTIIAKNLRFFARQGRPLHGDGDERNSNFHQLPKLRLTENPETGKWLDRKKDRYTSPEIQNEVLKVMALTVLRAIAKSIQSCEFFALMADEMADVSNKEHVVVCLCYVDKDFEAHEEFVGIYQVESIRSDVLITVLKDTLLCLNLPLSRCRGQCYYGASNMTGSRNGVETQLLKEEP